MDKDTRLGLLASAILDGTPGDWASSDVSGDAEERALARQLQVVARIAAVHRGDPVSEHGSRGTDATPAVQPQRPGSTLAPANGPEERPWVTWGHLRLLDVVGRGAYGEVYRAWDPRLDREVALKLLRADPGSGGDVRSSVHDPERVVDEGRLLARVRHPHVITVYGAERRGGRVGLWMEFIHGRTLDDIVRKQGPFGAREAAAIGADLCRALSAVHHAGLLHRDVTARNVMREDGGRVVLMDFGAGEETSLGPRHAGAPRLAGTPVYMAPELFGGAAPSRAADLYAMGALLFYLVSGTFPVTGRSVRDLRDAHARGTRSHLRDARPDLPAPFVAVVEKAVAAEPSARFTSAGALEAALEATLAPARTEATGSALPSAWRRRAVAIAAASVVAAAAAASPWGRAVLGGGDGKAASVAPAQLTTRKVADPDGVWVFSNPSADGRYAAGMVTETGDAAIVDLAAGTWTSLGFRGDSPDGYASLGTVSPDGQWVTVDWYTGNDGALRIARADGTGHRTLVAAPGHGRAFEWSRDGRLLLAALTPPGQGATAALVAVEDGAVRTLASVSGEPDHMTLSPDGRYVVFDAPEPPPSCDRDLFVLDAHTGHQWPLGPSPGHDTAPFWTPDGSGIVFLSDRNRSNSLWLQPMLQGRPSGEPRLVRDGIGRVWLRGFTAEGALHYALTAGFAEVYLGPIDGSPSEVRPLSPREALSNFYPMWSPDGRYVAYGSERGPRGRELWVHDTQTGTDARVPYDRPIGRPFGWSPDASGILVSGWLGGTLAVVDRVAGTVRAVGPGGRAAWPPSGIVVQRERRVEVRDPVSGRVLRSWTFEAPAFTQASMAADGRSVLALRGPGALVVTDTATGEQREWQDAAVTRTGPSLMAPTSGPVAYKAWHLDATGGIAEESLRLWPGTGPPRELLRVRAPEQIHLVAWEAGEQAVLVVRRRQPQQAGEPGQEALWRVPVQGGAPAPTGLAMNGLRDISIHPDGRQIAFNAGWKSGESWVMEHALRP